MTVETFNEKVAEENIKAIKYVLKKKGNLKKLDIFDEEKCAISPKYETEKRYFRLSDLYYMSDAGTRVETEAKKIGFHVTALKLMLVFKEIYDCKVCIPLFKEEGGKLNVTDGVHRIYILYQLLKEEDPKVPVLILRDVKK